MMLSTPLPRLTADELPETLSECYTLLFQRDWALQYAQDRLAVLEARAKEADAYEAVLGAVHAAIAGVDNDSTSWEAARVALGSYRYAATHEEVYALTEAYLTHTNGQLLQEPWFSQRGYVLVKCGSYEVNVYAEVGYDPKHSEPVQQGLYLDDAAHWILEQSHEQTQLWAEALGE
jgi:hypothetical protein